MSFYFFVSPDELHRGAVLLRDNNLQHLRSLRLVEGDLIILADGKGRAFYARIKKLSSKAAETKIIEEMVTNTEPPLQVNLFIGISKADKMERVVRQAVELGVKKIIPVITARTVVRLPENKGKEKSRRWQRIAASAAAQCRRSYIPEVKDPLTFEEIFSLLNKEELIIIPYEEEKERFLLPLLEGVQVPPVSLAVFTGPEGGISFAEMEKLNKLAGACPVSLGKRILRAETAPLAVLAIIMSFWGDIGRPGRT